MTDQRRQGRPESAGREKRAGTGIPGGLCDDEVVCFIAGRYHTTSREVLQRFFVQDGLVSETDAGAFRLEENEMEILRGLTSGGHS